MKIAIASPKKNQNSEISSQAACRASFFLIFDENGALIETLINPFKGAGDGAGLGVVKMLEDKRISAVIAERFGGEMIDTMEKWRIDHYQMTGAIMKSISRIKNSDDQDA